MAPAHQRRVRRGLQDQPYIKSESAPFEIGIVDDPQNRPPVPAKGDGDPSEMIFQSDLRRQTQMERAAEKRIRAGTGIPVRSFLPEWLVIKIPEEIDGHAVSEGQIAVDPAEFRRAEHGIQGDIAARNFTEADTDLLRKSWRRQHR
jgi:hypothetical protein